MATGTTTSGNVEFGPCQITFGAVDLGSFKGGVTTNYSYTVVKSKPDQLSTANNAWVTEESIVVTVPILETDISNMQYIMPTGTYATSSTKKEITIGGTQLASADFQQLILTPTTDNSFTLDTDSNNKITIHKALCMGPIEKTYNMEGERVITVEFHGFADTTKAAGEQLMSYGDMTT